MARRKLQDRRALVTGASSGIGRALALELARHGADLILLARRGDRLAEVADQIRRLGRRAEIVVGDVTDPAARLQAIQTAQEKFGGLDLLVNNAGVAAHGRFVSAQADRMRPIMEVNFFAPAELIREAMPLLLEGRQPIVVNVGSILGKRGCPHKSEYSASKFALHGFSEALRAELTPFGIDVLVVVAGPTDTEHFDHLLEDQGELPWGDPRRASPERVARSIVRAIERDRREVVTSCRGWFLVTLNRFFPRLVDGIMARYG
jgi:short-subunit dehydrogenase